jgi:CelD/BcsL family acetyltransferase involved in cellulose biosynthesis
MISVEIRAPDAGMISHWDALARRAAANTFMHPAALCEAARFAKVHVLLAWNDGNLVGLWALRERRFLRVLPKCLVAPPYEYAFVATPVVDPDHADEVMPAFLDAIANARALPNVIQMQFFESESKTFQALKKALEARPMLMLAERERAYLYGESGRKRSGSTGKKLRQDWNRLSSQGVAEVVNDRAPEAVRAAFEIFLELESESWKGDKGTALLSDDDHASFARDWISALAAHGNASVALLQVNDKPIAAQVLLYSGTTAYTWKTAFDAAFSKFSPGALLIDKLTDSLFAEGITAIDSCSAAGSFMAQLWTGRRANVDMLIDVGAHKSISFYLAALGERAYAVARAQRNRLRAMSWPLPGRKALAAITRS